MPYAQQSPCVFMAIITFWVGYEQIVDVYLPRQTISAGLTGFAGIVPIARPGSRLLRGKTIG